MTEHHHAHGHSHSHDHHAGNGNERRVFWAMLLTGGFMIAEVIGGLLSGSLALLADAGHMLTDFAALTLAWFGFRIARRPVDFLRTYGYQRFQVLAAFVNGIALFAIVIWIVIEALLRLFEPHAILGSTMLAIAVLGLLVNIAAFRILHGGDRENLNIRGAAAHVVGDLLGSVAAILAAGVILTTGWTPIDPLLSLLVALLILRSAWKIVRDSGHILLEGTPPHIHIDDIRTELTADIAEVEDVHHVHAWSLTPRKSLVTLHITVAQDVDRDAVLQKVSAFLQRRWQVEHATVQVEHGRSCPDAHSPVSSACR